MILRKWATMVSILLLMPLAFAFAQGTAEDSLVDEEDFPIEVEPMPANTVSCFDYYTFGSVQANLTAQVSGTVSGAPIAFSGTIVNENPYPVVDGSLYVKVFRNRGSTNDGNGPEVVDQFLVKGDIVIPAKGSVPISFRWNVPTYAQSGDYKIATFFTTSRKFNLLGLSFTDDVVGNTVPFTVNGESAGIVKFDKASVTLNGEPYLFAAFPPRMSAVDPVILKAKVTNTSNTSQRTTVVWSISQWDAQLRENVVQEESKQVTIPANSSSEVSVTVSDSKYPVYLVTGSLKWNDAQSYIGTRFVREGVDRTRINFPGIMSYPLKAGEVNTLFSCVHNSGEAAAVSGGRLDLTLADRNGTVIHEYSYTGDITGAMMGVASQFTPEKTYDYFTLTARLYQGEEFVDEANLVYDCNQITPGMCMPEEEVQLGSFLSSKQAIMLIGGGLIAILALVWVYRRIGRRSMPNTSQLPPM